MSSKKRLSNLSLTNSSKRSRNSSSESIPDTPSTSHLKNSKKLDEIFREIKNSSPESTEENIPWIRFYQFIEHILNISTQNKEISKKKGNCIFSSVLTNDQLQEWPDINEIQKVFRCIYTKAASIKKIPFISALNRVKEYFSEDSFVTTHPDYPKAPLTAYSIYLRKMNLPMFSSHTAAYQNAENPIVIEANQEAEEQKNNFFYELEQFLEKNRSSLLPNHIKFIEKKIISENKKKRDVFTTPKKCIKKKEKITPFDIYKKSKNHKFLDLPFEEREAKLQRHYEKLSDEKKKIFEELALND